MSKDITQKFLKDNLEKFKSSTFSYLIKDNDYNRAYTNPDEIYTDGKPVKETMLRVPSYWNARCFLKTDKKLKHTELKVVEEFTKKPKILEGGLFTAEVPAGQKIVKKSIRYFYKSYNEDYNKDEIVSECLTNKNGDQRAKVFPKGSMPVIYKKDFITYLFPYETLHPEEFVKGKLVVQPLTIVDPGSLDDKIEALKSIEAEFLGTMDNEKIKAFLSAFKVLTTEDTEELSVTKIEKKYKIHRKSFVQILMTWYHLTGKKAKYITDNAKKCGVYIVKPKFLFYKATLKTEGDLEFLRQEILEIQKKLSSLERT